jgi:two-component system phosphate regulon sensor histidine kinase PhoR
VTWFLLLLVLLLAGLLAIHWQQRRHLLRWLENPRIEEIPDGTGSWRKVFTRLQQLRKQDGNDRSSLVTSRDHYRLVVETLPDGVILLDRTNRIEWLNAAACQLFSLDFDRDIGTLIEQLLRQTTFIDYLRRFRQSGKPEALVMPRNGDHPLQVLSMQLLPFPEGGALLLCRDITEIARADTTRRDFIANVSHELRTPLTVISGFLEQMTADAPLAGETARSFLVLMDEQARRMNRLVEDLLTLSRLENATEPPRDERVDVPQMINSLLAEIRALSGGRHKIEAGEVAQVCVSGSNDELRSAFGNLLSNAVRYTPAGGRITFSWQEEEGGLAFAVTDNGIGIPPEHIPRLSERFYRVDKGRSTSSGGTGLGLAIVKHVLARHQGSLQVRSDVGQGSTFSACIPLTRKLL